MDTGQLVFILSQLILGALASFFAIMLWSKTREISWMLIVIGTFTAYIEIIYSVLSVAGFAGRNSMLIGSVSMLEILLPSLRMIFFIAAFYIMVVKYKKG